MNEKTNTIVAEWYRADSPDGFDELSDLDYACMLLPDLDYESQLNAIKDLLKRHLRADEQLSEEIKEIEVHARQLTGIRNQQAIDEWVDRLHDSVYQDAAHSMAAVGMLAPLIESIFHQMFLNMRAYHLPQSLLPKHQRWDEAEKDKWDCHFAWEKGKRNKNLVEGIIQLSEAVGLIAYLPEGVKPKIHALFTYRNKMFHHGFEWPIEERRKFQQSIISNKWDDSWFNSSTHDKEPWIYYMTETYISDCILLIEQCIEGIGCFAKALSRQLAQQENSADR